MTAYNEEAYIRATIDSVLAQTYTDFEFIIVNDGSTDSTHQILEDYAASDNRIRIINQPNAGTTAATVNGMNAATGEYVARMDADDLSLETRFEKQVKALDQRPDCVAVTSYFEHFRDDGSIKMVTDDVGPEELIGLYNLFSNRIGGHGQVMFRRDAYVKAGGYDPQFRSAEDYDLWCRMIHLGRFALIEEVLYRWRVGHGSTSDKTKNVQIECTTQIIAREYQRLTGLPLSQDTARAMIDLWWARKPENTPLTATLKVSRAMNRIVNSYFEKHRDLRDLEPEARKHIAQTWKWRVPLAGKANIIRRALLLMHAAFWAISAVSSQKASKTK